MAQTLLCTTCLHQGEGVKATRGSFWIELLLWLTFLIPGLVYSVWRLTTRYQACAVCGGASLIPLHSPRALQLLEPKS